MFVKSKCIVLSSVKFGEADLIVRTFTKEVGPISFMLKGVRKSKKGKFKVASFQPMTLLEIEFNFRENKNLQYLTEAKVFQNFHGLQTSFYKSSILIFVAEVLSNSLKEEAKNKSLFEFVEGFLMQLDKSEKIGNYPIQFCLELSKHLGFYPSYENPTDSFFDLLEGSFTSIDVSIYCRSGDEVEYLKSFIGTTNFEDIAMNQALRRDLLHLLQQYFELHIPSYSAPRSLEVIKEVLG